MKTVIIVQARMTSTRLPGKVLKEVLGKPLLEYQIERLRRVKLADGIVIATTNNESDQPVVELCTRLNIHCFRGSEADVLARYQGAAVQYCADTVVRITADCPVIDPDLCDEVIETFQARRKDVDYIMLKGYPCGLNIEVFSFKALNDAYTLAPDGPDREHVTTYIYRHSDRFRCATITCPENLSHHRWTVDTPEDFCLISKLLEELYPRNPNFRMKDILDLLERHKDWYFINAAVQQKKYGE